MIRGRIHTEPSFKVELIPVEREWSSELDPPLPRAQIGIFIGCRSPTPRVQQWCVYVRVCVCVGGGGKGLGAGLGICHRPRSGPLDLGAWQPLHPHIINRVRMLKSGITNPLKSLYDRRICTLLGLSESVCGHDTTGTDVVFVRPDRRHSSLLRGRSRRGDACPS